MLTSNSTAIIDHYLRWCHFFKVLKCAIHRNTYLPYPIFFYFEEIVYRVDILIPTFMGKDTIRLFTAFNWLHIILSLSLMVPS